MQELLKECFAMKKSYLMGIALILSCGVVSSPVGGQAASLSIEEAIQLALINNPDVAIARLAEDTAKYKLKQSRGNNSLSWTASATLTEAKSGKNSWAYGDSNSIRASLPIYSGKANQNSIKSSELGIDIAKLKTQRKWETMRLDVIKAYYDALEARKQMAVYQDTVDKYQKHLINVEQLFSAGSKAKIEVLRSQVELSNAKQSLIKGQNAYDNSLNVLRNLLYMSQQEPIELTDDFSYTPFEMTANDCADFAVKNRKEIKVGQYELQQKELAVKIAEAGYSPSVDASLSYGWDKLIPDSSKHNITARVGASWNIFDSGVTKAKVDASKVDVETAKLSLAKSVSDIDMSVRKDYNSMREAEKRFESTKSAIKQAEEDYFIANERYKAGEGIMLDIIDAQEALATAKQNYISAQYDYARYKASVECDMGSAVIPSLEAAINGTRSTESN